MDVTPTPKMLEAMRKFTDGAFGDEPSPLEVSQGANTRRLRRQASMDWLHQFAGLCMREGVNRAVRDARAAREGARFDSEDRSAAAKARDDAQAGAMMVKDIRA